MSASLTWFHFIVRHRLSRFIAVDETVYVYECTSPFHVSLCTLCLLSNAINRKSNVNAFADFIHHVKMNNDEKIAKCFDTFYANATLRTYFICFIQISVLCMIWRFKLCATKGCGVQTVLNRSYQWRQRDHFQFVFASIFFHFVFPFIHFVVVVAFFRLPLWFFECVLWPTFYYQF